MLPRLRPASPQMPAIPCPLRTTRAPSPPAPTALALGFPGHIIVLSLRPLARRRCRGVSCGWDCCCCRMTPARSRFSRRLQSLASMEAGAPATPEPLLPHQLIDSDPFSRRGPLTSARLLHVRSRPARVLMIEKSFFPYGRASFESIRRNEQFFVDNTAYIKEFEETPIPVLHAASGVGQVPPHPDSSDLLRQSHDIRAVGHSVRRARHPQECHKASRPLPGAEPRLLCCSHGQR